MGNNLRQYGGEFSLLWEMYFLADYVYDVNDHSLVVQSDMIVQNGPPFGKFVTVGTFEPWLLRAIVSQMIKQMFFEFERPRALYAGKSPIDSGQFNPFQVFHAKRIPQYRVVCNK